MTIINGNGGANLSRQFHRDNGNDARNIGKKAFPRHNDIMSSSLCLAAPATSPQVGKISRYYRTNLQLRCRNPLFTVQGEQVHYCINVILTLWSANRQRVQSTNWAKWNDTNVIFSFYQRKERFRQFCRFLASAITVHAHTLRSITFHTVHF